MSKKILKADITFPNKKETWLYSKRVKEHFFNPRNIMKEGEEKKFKADGVGVVGSPVCGDMMKVWIKVDPKTQRIKECKWRTFGCASAIASTSIMSEMVKGMKIKKAMKITAKDILKELGGLPPNKIHCSVLGDQALKAAIEDYLKNKK
jgi:nitrogen fixation NifU-like protein/NifU-like protein